MMKTLLPNPNGGMKEYNLVSRGQWFAVVEWNKRLHLMHCFTGYAFKTFLAGFPPVKATATLHKLEFALSEAGISEALLCCGADRLTDLAAMLTGLCAPMQAKEQPKKEYIYTGKRAFTPSQR